ncbi:hypothetical protein HMPREF0063_12649 [Aeromicrobium marinum DSM 15272]|uniref:Uncharacterized protein n=1 Tax=Aeromicrobium marinum DSM 15272 TaxID=585531 RepID=E2SF40_9ACTN|nr:hypothetical protein [Aeromicrobium marinum]EFQ82125.1 hypothetical protein HMPREF0063_12649 [Aeromicrobium marinum DSM 15272]
MSGDSGGDRGGRRGWGRRANEAADHLAGSADARTGESAQRAAAMLALAVRILRIPTLVVVVLPVPFIVATALVVASADGAGRVLGAVVVTVMTIVWGAFAWRRHRIIEAVSEPTALATELGIMVSLGGKVDETRGVLEQLAGGGGARVFSRLRGAWSGVTLTGRWIDGIGDLPRARYFAPPRIGTTVSMAIAALWLVPVSIVVALFAVIGAVAGSL